jgi:hypothetical protein
MNGGGKPQTTQHSDILSEYESGISTSFQFLTVEKWVNE